VEATSTAIAFEFRAAGFAEPIDRWSLKAP
jgi:hypothetical protein